MENINQIDLTKLNNAMAAPLSFFRSIVLLTIGYAMLTMNLSVFFTTIIIVWFSLRHIILIKSLPKLIVIVFSLLEFYFVVWATILAPYYVISAYILCILAAIGLYFYEDSD